MSTIFVTNKQCPGLNPPNQIISRLNSGTEANTRSSWFSVQNKRDLSLPSLLSAEGATPSDRHLLFISGVTSVYHNIFTLLFCFVFSIIWALDLFLGLFDIYTCAEQIWWQRIRSPWRLWGSPLSREAKVRLCVASQQVLAVCLFLQHGCAGIKSPLEWINIRSKLLKSAAFPPVGLTNNNT